MLRTLSRNRTSSRSLLQEILDDLRLHVVAGFFSDHGTELPELSQQAVLVLWIALFCGEARLVGRVCRDIF